MAEISLTNGEIYSMAKLQNEPVITKSSDGAAAATVFRNRVYIASGSANRTDGYPTFVVGHKANIHEANNAPLAAFSTYNTTQYDPTQGQVWNNYNIMLNNNTTTDKAFTGIAFNTTTQDLSTRHIGAHILGVRNGEAGNTASKTLTSLVFGTNENANADCKERLRVSWRGTIGINSQAPSSSLQINCSDSDYETGILLVRDSDSVSAGALLGGIGFDSLDGNVPSKIYEASAYIAAYASEDHGTSDKGGKLVLGISKTDDDDDTVSREIIRIEGDGHVEFCEAGDTNDHFWIDNDGNSRIGTSDGNLDIHVEGTYDSANHCARFDSSGKLYLYDLATTNQDSLEINNTTGELTEKGSTIKIKKDVINLPTSSMDDLLKLTPRQFAYKRDDRIDYGFIAEEAGSVNTCFTTWGPDYTYDASGSKVVKADAKQYSMPVDKYEVDSDNITPSDVNDRAVLAAMVLKIQDLEARLAAIESS